MRGTEMECLGDPLPGCRREVEVAGSLWTPRRPGTCPFGPILLSTGNLKATLLGKKNKKMVIMLFD